MAITLFFKECKEILRSITYYVFLICTISFFITQMDSVNMTEKPMQGQESYGTKYSDDETIIIESNIDKLLYDLSSNSFVTYPIGFYKKVTLDQRKQNEIYKILEAVTGISSDKLQEKVDYYRTSGEIDSLATITRNENLSYETFCSYFEQVDTILGGGSSYSSKQLYLNTQVNKTYEDALNDYESIFINDRVSGAYARLFSDYMGIVLAIFPVFLAVTRSLKDRRAKAEQVIFSKQCSSIIMVTSRYFAIITMILIPILILSVNPLLQSVYVANYNGITADYFAFIKAIFGWLIPTIIFTVSMGFLLTEVSSGTIAILVQGGWWLVSISYGGSNLIGHVGKNLIPRFNTVGEHEFYKSIFQELVVNRIGYTVVGISLLITTMVIYDLKRRGKLNYNGKIFKHN